MSPPDTSKRRAARVPADHYRRPGRLARWKRGLALAALLLAGGWWAWGLTRPDGGRSLKFSHQRRLAPGLGAGLTPEKLRALNPEAAGRSVLAGADPAAPVRLTCGSCHQPEGPSGASMQPVAYERHCAGCHPLRF